MNYRSISIIHALTVAAFLAVSIESFTIIRIPHHDRHRASTIPETKNAWSQLSTNRMSTTAAATKTDVVDAEFAPVVEEDADMNQQTSKTTGTVILSDKSLLDLSFELDNEFSKSRIPFIDTTVATDISKKRDDVETVTDSTKKNNYIDVKLAFIVTLDNVQYGIGIPYDTAAAITYEQADGTIECISPDLVVGDKSENDMTELIAIMATQLQENVGADLQLQHTPRVLTVIGPIDKYTKDWQTTLTPQPISATQLLDTLMTTPSNSNDDADDDDPQMSYFHNLMKEDLGQVEYDKIMNSDDDDNEDEDMKELMKLFRVPFGNNDDESSDDMNELLSTLLTPEVEYENAKQSFGFASDQQQQDNNGYTGLKLISYMFANGKSYSLVQLLQPYVIVGKYVIVSSSDSSKSDDDNNDEMGYFELLLPDEEQILIPRLEEICTDDLQKANLTFSRKTTTTTK